MQHFAYEGRNRHGELVKGRIESPNAQAVVQWMMGAGIVPVKISAQAQAASQGSLLDKMNGRGTLNATDLLLFTRQLGTMVRAGLPMMQALSGMQSSSGNPKLAALLGKLREDLDQGLELSVAMSHHPHFFDDYYVSMIRVGEGAGRLDEIFVRLALQLEFERDMRQKIKSALRYPTFVVGAIAIAIGILTLFVIPVFATVYASMKVELTLQCDGGGSWRSMWWPPYRPAGCCCGSRSTGCAGIASSCGCR